MIKPVTRKTQQKPFADSNVEAVFASYPDGVRNRLLALRQLIFDTAASEEEIGPLVETLKWGQPSYLTDDTGSGTTLRIDAVKNSDSGYALYFNCQTNLAAMFRDLFPGTFNLGGKRSILLDVKKSVPEQSLKQCIVLALTYHLRKKHETK